MLQDRRLHCVWADEVLCSLRWADALHLDDVANALARSSVTQGDAIAFRATAWRTKEADDRISIQFLMGTDPQLV